MAGEQLDSEQEKKAREGRILFIVFGTLITVLIAAMYFIDLYAQNASPAPAQVHDAADR